MKSTKGLIIVLSALLITGCGKQNAATQTSQAVIQETTTAAVETTENSTMETDGDTVEYTTVELTDIMNDQYQIEEDIKAEFETGDYTFEEPLIVLDPYGVSPLTALVCFNTEKASSVTVTVKGKDEYSDIKHTYSSEETSHTIPVYGLYAGTDNTVIIDLSTGESQNFTVATEPLPNNCQNAEVITCKDPSSFEGLTFASPTSGGNLYVIGYDVNGDVRWYVPDSFIGGYEMTRIENGHMVMASGRVSVQPYYGTGILEFNALGKLYCEYDISGAFHHDFKYLDNGNILICSQVTKTGCVEDTIVEIKADTGEMVRAIDLKDILPWQENHSANYKEKDWFHNNSVDFDKATNSIILSGRHIDGVISIDYDTTKLNWILGSPEGWSDEWQKYFFTPEGDNFEWSWAQHSARVNPDGSIFIFDNGNNKSKSKETAVAPEDEYSRGVIYDIDPENMTISQRWEFGKERGVDFYSMYISEVDWIDNGHYIVHSGGIIKNEDGTPGLNPFAPGAVQSTSIVEIDMNGSTADVATEDDVVYELKIPANSFRSERMDVYAPEEEYTLCEKGKLLGKFDETICTSDEISVSDTPDAVMNDGSETAALMKDITVTRETDRVLVEGEVAEPSDETKIYIVLKPLTAGEKDKVYDAAASKVYVQIANTGLSGDYDIWIMIDGKTIDTQAKVSF